MSDTRVRAVIVSVALHPGVERNEKGEVDCWPSNAAIERFLEMGGRLELVEGVVLVLTIPRVRALTHAQR